MACRVGMYPFRSGRGVRLQKGDGTSVDNTVYSYGATDYDTEYSVLYGRY